MEKLKLNIQKFSTGNEMITLDNLTRYDGKIKNIIPTKVSDLTNDSGFMNGLFIATYGTTSYDDVKAAVDANKIVYCYVSNNGRYAFLAYSNTTSYEFQYYRSNSNSHTTSNGRDAVFVYKITKNSGTGTWTTTERKTEAFYQAGDNINLSASTNTEIVTINADIQKVSNMPTAGSTYNNKIYQYIGTTGTYTKGYFYLCDNSTGSYAWHQIDVQPSSSGGQVYQHISTSSSDDFGKNSTNAIDLTTLQKGTHIFKNISVYSSIYYKYKKTSSSSYTSTYFSLNAYYDSSSAYTSYFIIEVYEDMSGGIYELGLSNDTAVVLIKIYTSTTYAKQDVTLYISDSTTGTLSYGRKTSLASQSQLQSVYSLASSASQTANACTTSVASLDIRVSELEQEVTGQTEYISNASGAIYPPRVTWSTSTGNYFTFTKSPADFKEGTDENIYVTLTPDTMYSNLINVEINYNYMTAMIDTSDITIPNVVLKLYSTSDGSLLTEITLGDVLLEYNSASNKWAYINYGLPYDYIMGGNSVSCKLFYGNASGDTQSIPVVYFYDLLTQVTGDPYAYYIDLDKIAAVSSEYNEVPIIKAILDPNAVDPMMSWATTYLTNSTATRSFQELNSSSFGYCDIIITRSSNDISVYITFNFNANYGQISTNLYKAYINTQGNSSLWYLQTSWSQY